jgi:SUN domain-containing protein 1/2
LKPFFVFVAATLFIHICLTILLIIFRFYAVVHIPARRKNRESFAMSSPPLTRRRAKLHYSAARHQMLSPEDRAVGAQMYAVEASEAADGSGAPVPVTPGFRPAFGDGLISRADVEFDNAAVSRGVPDPVADELEDIYYRIEAEDLNPPSVVSGSRPALEYLSIDKRKVSNLMVMLLTLAFLFGFGSLFVRSYLKNQPLFGNLAVPVFPSIDEPVVVSSNVTSTQFTVERTVFDLVSEGVTFVKVRAFALVDTATAVPRALYGRIALAASSSLELASRPLVWIRTGARTAVTAPFTFAADSAKNALTFATARIHAVATAIQDYFALAKVRLFALLDSLTSSAKKVVDEVESAEKKIEQAGPGIVERVTAPVKQLLNAVTSYPSQWTHSFADVVLHVRDRLTALARELLAWLRLRLFSLFTLPFDSLMGVVTSTTEHFATMRTSLSGLLNRVAVPTVSLPSMPSFPSLPTLGLSQLATASLEHVRNALAWMKLHVFAVLRVPASLLVQLKDTLEHPRENLVTAFGKLKSVLWQIPPGIEEKQKVVDEHQQLPSEMMSVLSEKLTALRECLAWLRTALFSLLDKLLRVREAGLPSTKRPDFGYIADVISAVFSFPVTVASYAFNFATTSLSNVYYAVTYVPRQVIAALRKAVGLVTGSLSDLGEALRNSFVTSKRPHTETPIDVVPTANVEEIRQQIEAISHSFEARLGKTEDELRAEFEAALHAHAVKEEAERSAEIKRAVADSEASVLKKVDAVASSKMQQQVEVLHAQVQKDEMLMQKIEDRVAQLESKPKHDYRKEFDTIYALKTELREVDTRLGKRIDAVEAKLETATGETNKVVSQLQAQVKETLDTASSVHKMGEQMRSAFDTRIASLEDRVDLVAKPQGYSGHVDFASDALFAAVVDSSTTYSPYGILSRLFSNPLKPWERRASHGPETILSSDMKVGRCWSMKGSNGYALVRLGTSVRPSSFSVEHVFQQGLQQTSAPRQFAVYGYVDEYVDEPVFLGRYEYLIGEGHPAEQRFAPQVDLAKYAKTGFQLFRLQIESNHGDPNYTCIYRFHVYGLCADEKCGA